MRAELAVQVGCLLGLFDMHEYEGSQEASVNDDTFELMKRGRLAVRFVQLSTTFVRCTDMEGVKKLLSFKGFEC
jgi:hypothetical protein